MILYVDIYSHQICLGPVKIHGKQMRLFLFITICLQSMYMHVPVVCVLHNYQSTVL